MIISFHHKSASGQLMFRQESDLVFLFEKYTVLLRLFQTFFPIKDQTNSIYVISTSTASKENHKKSICHN